MATQPTPKVEIAFVSTPLEIAPTWVDVSTYVRLNPPVTIRRGRQSELDQFDAGYCTLTLSNRDRRFDPSNAAGPYFGNLIPRKRIRVTATWSAVDYVQFTGWVTGWPQDFNSPDGKDATVTIQAIDDLGWLANAALPNDLVYSYANATIGSLALFLRGADTTLWSDAKNGYYATPVLGIGRTTTSIAAGSTSPGVSFDGSTVWRLNQQYTNATSCTIAFWLQTTYTHSSASCAIIGGNSAGGGNRFGIGLTSGGMLEITLNSSTGFFTVQVKVNDGLPHHVVLALNSVADTASLYVDGVLRQTATSAFRQPYLDVVGASQINDYAGVINLFPGTVEDLAVWNKELSAAEILAFYNRTNGYLEEPAATRVTRLLDDVGWPATWRTLTTTARSTCGELVYNGANALSKLQEVQRTEQGRIFAAKNGNLTFLERYYAQEQTVGNTVQQIFSDDGGATALAYSTFGFQYNEIDVTNDARVTTPTTWASASDATSIAANGLQSKKVDTILTKFTDADLMARGLVTQGKTATYRLPAILAYPAKNTTRWANVLGLELGHRVSFEITPMKVGAQNAQEVTIEQIEWSIGEIWSLTIAGSPCFGGVSGATTGWFVIGTSLIGSTTDLIGY
jgi:hypothetical protein